MILTSMPRSLDIVAVAMNVGRRDGQGRAFLELLRALLARGHRVALHAHRVDDDLAAQLDFRRVPRLPGPQVVDDLGVFARATLGLRRARHDVGLVLGPSAVLPCPYVYYGMFSYRGWRSTWSAGERGHLQHRLHARVAIPLEHAVASRAAALLVASGGVASELVPEGHRSVTVLPLGVDPDEFTPASPQQRAAAREQLGLPGGAFAVGFVGEYRTGRKGLRVLLQALSMGPGDEHLVVNGRGPEARLAAEVAQLGLRKRVHVVGFAVHPRTVYDAVDAVAVPSSYEPYSLVALEAAACGLGVIVSARAGVAACLDGAAEVLLDPRDPSALRACIDRVRADVAGPRRLSALARLAAERLPWTKTAAQAAVAVEEVATR